MALAYTYKIIENEAKVYKHKCPTYEKYVLNKSYYNKQAYKKRLKYINELSKKYMYITTDADGIYRPCLI